MSDAFCSSCGNFLLAVIRPESSAGRKLDPGNCCRQEISGYPHLFSSPHVHFVSSQQYSFSFGD